MSLLLAHGSIVEALPFFGPMLVIVTGIAGLVARDRWRERR